VQSSHGSVLTPMDKRKIEEGMGPCPKVSSNMGLGDLPLQAYERNHCLVPSLFIAVNGDVHLGNL
jgi:hypothetical protein